MNPTEAAALAEIARVAYGWLTPETRDWLTAKLAEARRPAAPLVFREAGKDAAGRVQFEVGDAERTVTFIPAGRGVGWWLRAVKARPAGVAITGKSPSATRMLLRRGLAELENVCRPLAAELRRHGRAARGAAVYCPAISSPRIITD